MVEDDPSHWTKGWARAQSAAGDDGDDLQDWDIDAVSIDFYDFALVDGKHAPFFQPPGTISLSSRRAHAARAVIQSPSYEAYQSEGEQSVRPSVSSAQPAVHL